MSQALIPVGPNAYRIFRSLQPHFMSRRAELNEFGFLTFGWLPL